MKDLCKGTLKKQTRPLSSQNKQGLWNFFLALILKTQLTEICLAIN